MKVDEKKDMLWRKLIGETVLRIKDGNTPTVGEMSDSTGLDASEGARILRTAEAWVYREKVDNLLEQLQTGNLEGIEPIASLNRKERK